HGVVEKNVDGSRELYYAIEQLIDRLLVTLIDLQGVHIKPGSAELLGPLLKLGQIATRHERFRTCFRQGLDDLTAEQSSPARDDGYLSVQLQQVDNTLIHGRLRSFNAR